MRSLSTELLRQIWGNGPFPNIFLPETFCGRCMVKLGQQQLPRISIANGFQSVEIPRPVALLNPVEQRLVSPLLPSLQIIRDRRIGQMKV